MLTSKICYAPVLKALQTGAVDATKQRRVHLCFPSLLLESTPNCLNRCKSLKELVYSKRNKTQLVRDPKSSVPTLAVENVLHSFICSPYSANETTILYHSADKIEWVTQETLLISWLKTRMDHWSHLLSPS